MNDQDNFLVSLLLEDFKARWQELLNTSAEISTWTTIYYSALVLTIAWVLARNKKESLKELLAGGRITAAFLIISLALINVVYILGIAIKTYHIQQIGLYLYEVIGNRISNISGEPFNSWEEWRRRAFQAQGNIGEPEKVRSVYYSLMTVLPFGVSAFIFASYLKYEPSWRYYWLLRKRLLLLKASKRSRFRYLRRTATRRSLSVPNRWVNLLNVYFVLIVISNILAAFITAFLIFSINQKWKLAIREHKTALSETQSTFKGPPALRSVLKSLRRIDAGTQVGIDYNQYSSLLVDAKVQIEESSIRLGDDKLKEALNSVLDAYLDGKRAWDLSLKNDGYLPVESPEVQDWSRIYSFKIADGERLSREETLKVMWKVGRSRLDQVTTKFLQ